MYAPKFKPICDVCGHEVDDFCESMDNFFDRVTFIARCHGETQRVELSREEVDGSHISIGRAFVRPPRLSP